MASKEEEIAGYVAQIALLQSEIETLAADMAALPPPAPEALPPPPTQWAVSLTEDVSGKADQWRCLWNWKFAH